MIEGKNLTELRSTLNLLLTLQVVNLLSLATPIGRISHLA